MRISTVLSYWDYKRHVYQNNFPQKKNPPKRSFVPPFFSWTVFQWCTIRFLLVRKTTWFSLNSEITICFNEDNKGLMEYDRQRRKKKNALHKLPIFASFLLRTAVHTSQLSPFYPRLSFTCEQHTDRLHSFFPRSTSFSLVSLQTQRHINTKTVERHLKECFCNIWDRCAAQHYKLSTKPQPLPSFLLPQPHSTVLPPSHKHTAILSKDNRPLPLCLLPSPRMPTPWNKNRKSSWMK